MERFITTRAFTIILFSVAVVLGAVGILGGIESVGLAGLIAGAGAIWHWFVMHF